jgi:hypothetical protein
VVEHTEARVRAALRAYADLVEEEPRDLPVAGHRVRPPAHRRWRAPALVAAAAVAVVSGTVWLVAGEGDAPVASAPVSTTPGETAEGPSAAGTAPGSSAATGVPALPTPAEIGVAYPFDLYTHCGVLGADVAGTWFAADPPLEEGAGNPPPDWDNPYQRGRLTLVTATEAVFTDDAGHEVRLGAAPESARPAPCD